MNKRLTEYFKENLCAICDDKKCKKKPNRMIKCGVFYLVKYADIELKMKK